MIFFLGKKIVIVAPKSTTPGLRWAKTAILKSWLLLLGLMRTNRELVVLVEKFVLVMWAIQT